MAGFDCGKRENPEDPTWSTVQVKGEILILKPDKRIELDVLYDLESETSDLSVIEKWELRSNLMTLEALEQLDSLNNITLRCTGHLWCR